MARIIIGHGEEIDDSLALNLVGRVIAGGRVSEGRHGKHYCWATRFTFANGKVYVVITRDKRTPTSADSFYVYEEMRGEDK